MGNSSVNPSTPPTPQKPAQPEALPAQKSLVQPQMAATELYDWGFPGSMEWKRDFGGFMPPRESVERVERDVMDSMPPRDSVEPVGRGVVDSMPPRESVERVEPDVADSSLQMLDDNGDPIFFNPFRCNPFRKLS